MSDDIERGHRTGICAACESPQLAEINRDLESGLGLGSAALKYNISKSALYRHRAHCMPIQAALKDRRAKRALLAAVTPPAPPTPAVDPFDLAPLAPPPADAPPVAVVPADTVATTREILADVHAMNAGLAEVYRDVLKLRGIPPLALSQVIQRGYELEIKTSLALESRDGLPGGNFAFIEVVESPRALARVADAVHNAATLEAAQAAVDAIRAELPGAVDPSRVAKSYEGVNLGDWDKPAEIPALPTPGAPSAAVDEPGGVATPPAAGDPQDAPATCEPEPAPEPEPTEAEHGVIVHRLPEPTEAEIRADRDRRFERAFGRPAPGQGKERPIVMPPAYDGTIVMPETMPASWWDEH